MRFFGSPSSAIDLTLLAKRTLSRFFGFFAGHSLATTDRLPFGYDCWRGGWILVILWIPLQRSHFDAIEVRVPGAPLADEIVFILAMSTGPRVHARVAGLAASAISQWNGLR